MEEFEAGDSRSGQNESRDSDTRGASGGLTTDLTKVNGAPNNGGGKRRNDPEGAVDLPAGCQGDFSCAWDNKTLLQGRMLVMEDGVIFRGNSLGKEAQIGIAYGDLEVVKRGVSQLFIPNAIIFVTKSAGTHVFRNFWERDACFDLIKNTMKARAAAAPANDEFNRGGGSMTPSRTIAIPKGGGGGARSRSGTRSEPCSPRPGVLSNNLNTVDPESLFESPPDRNAKGSSSSRRSSGTFASVPTAQVVTNLEELNLMTNHNKLAIDRGSEENDCYSDGDGRGIVWQAATDEEVKMNQEAMTGAVQDSDAPQLVVVDSAELPISPRDFYKSFVSDESAFSLPDFHLARGDWEVDATSWQVDDSGENCHPSPSVSPSNTHNQVLSRIIRFKTPINIQFMNVPNQVRTSKQQRLLVFKGAGFIYDTTTTVEDKIPVSDCFHVEDRWVVQSVGDSRDRCLVSVKFRVVWKKWSMVKGLVETKVKSDVTNFNTAFLDGMREYIKGRRFGRIQRMASHRAMSETVSLAEAITSVAEGALPEGRAQQFLSWVGPAAVFFSFVCIIYFTFFWVYFQIIAASARSRFVFLPSVEWMEAGTRGPLSKQDLKTLFSRWGESNLLLRSLREKHRERGDRMDSNLDVVLKSTIASLDQLAINLAGAVSEEL